MKRRFCRSVVAGWLGGLAGNAVLGVAFSSAWLKSVLYEPTWQSPVFIELAIQRNLPLSVAGLVLLSGLHGALFGLLQPSIPGSTALGKGLFWGAAIWALYWLFQEWFIYVMLLREPLALALLELVVLLCGSLVEGIVIASLLVQAIEHGGTQAP